MATAAACLGVAAIAHLRFYGGILPRRYDSSAKEK